MAIAPATHAASKSGKTTGRRGSSIHPRLDLWNHSPTGFEWGYPGSGPAQSALHHEFKWDHISPLAGDEFCISGDLLECWCWRHEERIRDPEDCDQPAAALSGTAHRLLPSGTS